MITNHIIVVECSIVNWNRSYNLGYHNSKTDEFGEFAFLMWVDELENDLKNIEGVTSVYIEYNSPIDIWISQTSNWEDIDPQIINCIKGSQNWEEAVIHRYTEGKYLKHLESLNSEGLGFEAFLDQTF